MTQYTWSGQGTSSAWDNAGNWSPGGVPGQADLALFNGPNATVTGNEAAGAVDVVGPTDVSFAGTVVTSGLSGKASSFLVDNGATVGFTAGSYLKVLANRLTVGREGTGALLSYGGGTLTTENTSIGVEGHSQGELDVHGGSIWKNKGSIAVGQFGSGTLSITGSSRADEVVQVGSYRHGAPHRGNVVIGQHAGGAGTLNVSLGFVEAHGTLSVGGRWTRHRTARARSTSAQGAASMPRSSRSTRAAASSAKAAVWVRER